ncbi:MAG: carboxypeptidase-like regulatory domain-containing protein [Planctomycetota bacterium]
MASLATTRSWSLLLAVLVVIATVALIGGRESSPLSFATDRGDRVPEADTEARLASAEVPVPLTEVLMREPVAVLDTRPVVVRGRVSWPDGVAAYGAIVAQDLSGLSLGDGAAFSEAKAAMDGTFEVPVPRGVYRLVAHAGQVASEAVPIDTQGQAIPEPALVLRRLPRLRGLMTDSSGRPVQGMVRVISTRLVGGIEADPTDKAQRDFAGCDPSGDFRRDFDLELRLTVRGWAKGHAPTRTVVIEPGEVADAMRLVAREIVTLPFSVAHPDGRPWPDLEFGYGDPEFETMTPDTILWGGHSDARGDVVLAGVAAEESCTIVVRDPSSKDYAVALRIDSRVPGQRLVLPDDALQPASVDIALTGDVPDAPHGFRVVLVPLGGFATRLEVDEQSGDLHLENVHPGVSYRVHVLLAKAPSKEATDHRASRGSGRLVASKGADHARAVATAEFVARSGKQRIEVPFRRSGSCLLTVRHPDGRPVIGARIEVTGPTTVGEAAPSGETDSDGRLTIRNLLPVEHLVRVIVGARTVAQSNVRVESGAAVATDLISVR